MYRKVAKILLPTLIHQRERFPMLLFLHPSLSFCCVFLLSPVFWIVSSLSAFHDLDDCDITGQLFCGRSLRVAFPRPHTQIRDIPLGRKPPEMTSSASQSLLNPYCVLDGGDTQV